MNSQLLESVRKWAAQASPNFKMYVGPKGFTAGQIVSAIEENNEEGRLLMKMIENASKAGVELFKLRSVE